MTSGDNTSPKQIQLGLHIYMGGIGFQEFWILVFTGLAIRLFAELKATSTRPGWKKMLRILFATLALITVSISQRLALTSGYSQIVFQIRVIYRLVEFSEGVNSTLTDHEAFFYCLEAVPMLSALSLFNIWHPGAILVGPDSEFPKKEKKSKSKKQSKKGNSKQSRETGEYVYDDHISLQVV